MDKEIVPDVVIFGVPCILPETLAGHLGLKKNTLSVWRSTKKGPPYTKVGNNIFYPINEARRWFARSCQTTN